MWSHVDGCYLTFTTFGLTLTALVAIGTYMIAKEGLSNNPDEIGAMIFFTLLMSALIPLCVPYVLLLIACAFIGLLPLTFLVTLAVGVGYGAFHKQKVVEYAKIGLAYLKNEEP
jgi:hypothetical protein